MSQPAKPSHIVLVTVLYNAPSWQCSCDPGSLAPGVVRAAIDQRIAGRVAELVRVDGISEVAQFVPAKGVVGRCRLRPGDRRVWGGSGGSSQAGATIITASHVRPVSQTSLWAAAAAATLAQMA